MHPNEKRECDNKKDQNVKQSTSDCLLILHFMRLEKSYLGNEKEHIFSWIIKMVAR